MTRHLALTLVLALAMASLSACATHSEGSASFGKSAATALTPPPGSPFAEVQMGMNDVQVRNVLGDPDNSNAYMTGKMFIPFYFGPDTHRAEWMYKGKGRVVFSRNRWTGGLKVIKVRYEPTETAAR